MRGIRHSQAAPLTIEQARKSARILVIDDNLFAFEGSFERDGYHVQRWPQIKNLSQLTDGHFDLILLDIQGVGLDESPDRQGLGILDHIKKASPAQLIIVYSAQPQPLSAYNELMQADAILDKSCNYLDYKASVDRLLMTRSSVGYFVAVMNRELGVDAEQVPKAVSYAIHAFRRSDSSKLERYLRNELTDMKKVDRVLTVVSIGMSILGMAR